MSGARIIGIVGLILIFAFISVGGIQLSFGDRIESDSLDRGKADGAKRVDKPDETMKPPENPNKTPRLDSFFRRLLRPKQKVRAEQPWTTYKETLVPYEKGASRRTSEDSLLPPEEKRLDEELNNLQKAEAGARQWRRQQAEEKFSEGLRNYNAGMYQIARQNFYDALKYDPTHQKAKEHLNRVRRYLGEAVPPSREEMEKTLELEKIMREQTRSEIIQDYSRAQEMYEKAIKLPDSRLEESVTSLKNVALKLKNIQFRLAPLPSTERLEDIERGVHQLDERVQEEIAARERQEQILKKNRAEEKFGVIRRERVKWRSEKIKTLKSDIKKFVGRNQYDDALKSVQTLMELEPGKRRYTKLRDTLERKRREYHVEKFEAEREQGIQRVFDLLDQSRVPNSKLFELPTDWEERMKRRTPSDKGSEAEAVPDWKKNLMRKMRDTKVQFNFEDQDFNDVISALMQMGGFTIIVSQDVRDKERTVTLSVRNMSLVTALDWIIRLQKDLSYELKDEVVFVDLTSNIEGKFETEIYDIRDLLFQVRHFVAPEISLDLDDDGGAIVGEPPPPPPQYTDEELMQRLSEIIRMQEADSWANPEASISPHLGLLIIRQTKKVHAAIKRLLKSLRESALMMVALESRYIEVEEDFLEAIGMTWVPDSALSPRPTYSGKFGTGQTTDGGPVNNRSYRYYQFIGSMFKPNRQFSTDLMDGQQDRGFTFRYQLLGDSFAEFVLNVIRSDKRGTVLFAPRITVMNTQRAFIQVVTQESYVRGFDSMVGQNVSANMPDIAAFNTGVVLEVRPVVSADRKYITIEMLPATAILGPKGLQNRDFGAGFDVQFPQLVLRKIRTTVSVPDGGTVLMGGLMDDIENSFHAGIPFLSKIPVLGFLFRQTEKHRRRRQLLIFVKARIISYQEN